MFVDYNKQQHEVVGLELIRKWSDLYIEFKMLSDANLHKKVRKI